MSQHPTDPKETTDTLSAVGSSAHWPEGPLELVPQLVVVLDCDRPLSPSSRHLLGRVDEVRIGRGDRGAQIQREPDGRSILELRVPDRRVSSAHAKLSKRPEGWVLEDTGSKNGTFLDDERLAEPAILADGQMFEVGHTFLMFYAGRPAGPIEPIDMYSDRVHAPVGSLGTLSSVLARRFVELSRIARTDTPILLLGESGTGKEVVSRAVHAMAGRAGDFVPVNCGALPDTLIESELFGHRKGAFSGAAIDRQGLVPSADKGTLFLDEIGDLPLEVQPSLLRVIQEREVTPLGAVRPVKLDLRVVSATHRDLSTAVAAGAFRADLYARLAGFVLELPPLRHRREDLGILIGTLLRRLAGPEVEELALERDAGRALLRHPWPLNVRELESALKSALGLRSDNLLRLAHLPGAVQASVAGPAASASSSGISSSDITDATPATPLEERRRARLVALLTEHTGNVAAVARALGKQRTLVHRWLRRYGIDPDSFRQ
jgi:sigma-54 dependent transcriptional regulator, acetoin dehydrogenase operon transcriptional activator AcoR